MKLRPHHLLCTQFYKGNGYNEEFVEHMDYITDILRNKENFCVDVIYSTDDICSKCPHMLDINLCRTNDKVNTLDNKVIKYFNIEENKYNYKEVTRFIRENITKEILLDTCSDCSWFEYCDCKKCVKLD